MQSIFCIYDLYTLGSTLIGFLDARIIKAPTTHDTKSPAPSSALIARYTPSSPSLPLEATIAAITSLAPFANARNVAPANDSEIPSFTVIVSSAGDKYPSAVDPRT